MYALDYANRNFSYAYKGNYNNIYLFNDEKPVNFEVVETSPETFGYYIPVKLSTDDPDYVVSLINDPFSANFVEQIVNDLQGLLDTVTDTDTPQLLVSSTADYLLAQGYMEDIGQVKKVIDESLPFGYVEKQLYKIGNTLYVLGGDGFDLDEVLITDTNPDKTVKPFIDFDDEIDKEGNQLIVMVSSDGAKIDDAYLSVNQVNDNEIVLFIENMEGSNIFGSSVRVKTGSNISTIEPTQRRIIKHLLKAMDLAIDENKIVRILKKHNQDKDGQVVYYIKKGFLGLNSIITMTLNLPLGLLGSVAGTIAEAIEKEVRFGENSWRYYAKDGKVNENKNLFLPIDGLIDSINEQLVDKSKPNNITKQWITSIKTKTDAIIQWLYSQITGLKREISNQLRLFIKALEDGFDNLVSALKDIIKGIANYGIDTLLYINGIVVGIINSILDTIGFIFQAIGFLFNPKDSKQNTENLVNETGATVSMFLELIENGIDILNKIFSKKTLNAVVFFQIQLAVLLYKAVTNTDPKKSLNFDLPKADSVGYFTGFIVGFIIEEIITAMLTAGTANVAKASQLALKSMKETLQAVKNIPVKIATKFANIAQRGTTQVVLLFSNIRKLLDNLPTLLTDLLNWLKKVLDEAIAVLENAFKKLFPVTTDRARIRRAGLQPTKIDELGNITFCPIRS